MTLFAVNGVRAPLLAVAIRVMLLFGVSIALTHAEENLANKIKAAYLYNFTKFITWPSIQTNTFNICLVGNDQFKDLLHSLEDKIAQDKPIRILHYDTVKQVKNCQIVYFDEVDLRTEPGQPSTTLVMGNLANSLTVGSQPFFAETGGMIGFAIEQEKIRLHINLKVLKQSGLGISAKLLEVSTIVGED